MNITVVSIIVAVLLVVSLLSSIWIGVSLIIVGAISLTLFTESPSLQILANILWNNTHNSTMMALPLFIFMGEILFRSKISENLFKGLSPWMTFLPGGLIHVNVFASGMFAAVSGSSAATTATVGKITLPELLTKRNYNRSLSIGTLAGAGSLGFLIPPSTMLIIYGIMANVSIGQLFIAGIVPGAMIALGFSSYVIIRCLIQPSIVPKEKHYTWKERMNSITLVFPVIFLIVLVIGSIYSGWATPTEAASVGVIGALFFAAISRSLTKKAFCEAMMGAVKTTGMIMLIVAAASYLSVTMGYLGIPAHLAEYVGSLGLSRFELIIILTLVYIILGCMLEGASMIVMTLPIVLPLVTAAGFDPLWFGIYLIILIEIAQITPPIGFNLFVIKSIVPDSLAKIALYSLPSFLIILIVVAFITVYPNIVHWLPNLMMS